MLRALAVAMVVLGHVFEHSHPPEWVARAGPLGILGVELFFVLSGFLIGGILIQRRQAGAFAQPRELFLFWVERWMRTLPLYYFFLLLNLRLDWKGPSRLDEHWEYLGFLQNLAWPMPPFYRVSWSLGVEELFYFLFPLLLLGLGWLARGRAALVWAMGLLLVAPPLLRALAPAPTDWSGFDLGLRSVAIYRLDALIYGVAMAYAKAADAPLWRWLQRAGPAVAGALTLLAVAFLGALPFPVTAKGFSVYALALPAVLFALILPWADSAEAAPANGLGRWVTRTSLLSYSMYLGHIVVIVATNRALSAWGGAAVYERYWVLYPLYLTLTYLLAALTHAAIESPFLRWRSEVVAWLKGPSGRGPPRVTFAVPTALLLVVGGSVLGARARASAFDRSIEALPLLGTHGPYEVRSDGERLLVRAKPSGVDPAKFFVHAFGPQVPGAVPFLNLDFWFHRDEQAVPLLADRAYPRFAERALPPGVTRVDVGQFEERAGWPQLWSLSANFASGRQSP